MNTITKFKGLTNDFIFKYVFSHEYILIDLLNSYFEYIHLNRSVNRVLVKPESLIMPDKHHLKEYYGDIIVVLDNGNIISIEVYTKFGDASFNKSLVYLGRLFGNQLKKSEDYESIKETISINFITGNYERLNNEVINDYAFANMNTLIPLDMNKMKLVLIRLDLNEKKSYNKNEKRFNKWLRLMNTKSIEEMKEIGRNDKIMEEAIKHVEEYLKDYGSTWLDRLEYEKAAAKEEGIETGIIETAKNMLKFSPKPDITYISKVTGLSEQEIQDLQLETS